MPKITGQNGIELIKYFESCKLTAYLCPAGKWTIGWGHTKGVREGQTITQKQADSLLKSDLETAEYYVNKLNLNLNQNQFDALVSFCYNAGPGNLSKLVRNRTLRQIADAMLLYNKGGGIVLNGLIKRRNKERNLFLQPVNNEPTYKVKITATALNVREGIGTSHKIVRTLNKNAIVDVLSACNGWGQISDGWISLKYTERV